MLYLSALEALRVEVLYKLTTSTFTSFKAFKPQMKECMTLKCMFLFVVCETIMCICYAFTKEVVFSSALVVHLFICQLARLGKNYRD